MKKDTNETWPPPPVRPSPESEADDDDWLTANDFFVEVTWREYAVIVFAVLWGLLACFSVASHHHPAQTINHVLHIVQALFT